jgi:hypothetical protein
VTSRRKGCLLVLLAALLVLGAGLVWLFNSEIMDIDSCLDSGGRWGEDRTCEFEAPAK